MKYIQKQPEPESLRKWREGQLALGSNCYFKALDREVKRVVYQALWDDQGWICCYCCQGIADQSSHIEHFEPQSNTKDSQGNNPLSITYSNLLASCSPLPTDPNDPKQARRFPPHCGDYRGKKPIPVSPLDPACESYFVYNISNGKIEANSKNDKQKQQEANQTIDILNLNDADLTRTRLDALDAALIEIDLQDPQDAAALLAASSQKQLDGDGNARFSPFCVMIAYYLRTEFSLA